MIDIVRTPRSNLSRFKTALQRLPSYCGLLHCQACGLCLRRAPNSPQQKNLPFACSLDQWLCSNCLSNFQALRRVACQQCGLSLGPRLQAFGWIRCRHCRAKPLETIRTTVIHDYGPPFSNWVLALKYAGHIHLAHFLGNWLALEIERGVSDPQWKLPDVLIPVPISQKRLKTRGYNQAEQLARVLGQRWGRPVQTDWLMKVRDTGSQAQSSRHARLQNLQSALICTQKISSSIKIALVDDVITTGSTLQACTEAIQKAGGTHFHHLAICRTPE